MAKTTRRQRQSYDRKADQLLAITPVEYGGLQEAFDHLNRVLFEGELPDVFITYQRRAHSGGYFGANRFADRNKHDQQHEIALNPDGFVGKNDEFIVSILLHEMVHLWQYCFGKRPSRSYHDRQWSEKMRVLGLMPSSTGMVGGKTTGAHMAHYVLADGRYAQAFAQLAASGWKLNLQSAAVAGERKGPNSKTKFTCAACGQNVWGKPDTENTCTPCVIQAMAAELGDVSSDAIALVERYQLRTAAVTVAVVAQVMPAPAQS